MKGKVTKELLGKMVQARKAGATYREIEERFGVGRWTTLHYLKGMKPEVGYIESQWKLAEKKAFQILKERGFDVLIDLNLICPTSHFDILALKNEEKWLIDVTINEQKDLASKAMRVIPNFRCAVLYFSHDLEKNWFVELKRIWSR